MGDVLPDAHNVLPLNVSDMPDIPHVGMRGKDLSSEYLPMFSLLKIGWFGAQLATPDDSPFTQESAYEESIHYRESQQSSAMHEI